MTGASTNKINLSIIVPVLNERHYINSFVAHLEAQWQEPRELIFVDGGSTDGTWEWLQKQQLTSYRSPQSRAVQSNTGAHHANGNLYYFVHVDSTLPYHFDHALLQAHYNGATAGCFQLEFDSKHWLLQWAAAGSRWNHLLCRGGDQSLFITKKRFETLKGFNHHYKVCEDLELIKRLYQQGSFKVLPQKIRTSSRRFHQNGILRLLIHFGVLHLTHWCGAGPQFLYRYYRWAVR